VANDKLKRAKAQKNDEFYTQLEDIENELRYYKKHFKGKTIFCNCDDPYESNFFKYFAMNFNYLELKKLIATCYVSSPVMYTQLTLFGDEEEVGVKTEGRKPYKIEITEVEDVNGDGAIDLSDVEYLIKNKKNTLTLLNEDGDFRSDECIELLKESDIVVTNPPFSLFREYLAQLVEYDKKFIIIGNMNAIHYKEVFPLIQNDKMWLGVTCFHGGAAYFVGSKDLYDPKKMSNEKHAYIKDDKLYWRVNGVRWFTNLDIINDHQEMILYKKYSPAEYPTYENYDAIEVDNINKIPCDYYGKMGVPDSFLQRYNPNQFEIVGYGRGDFLPEIGYVPQEFLDDYRARGGRGHITAGMKSLCFYNSEHEPKFPYSRIIIRRKDHNEN